MYASNFNVRFFDNVTLQETTYLVRAVFTTHCSLLIVVTEGNHEHREV